MDKAKQKQKPTLEIYQPPGLREKNIVLTKENHSNTPSAEPTRTDIFQFTVPMDNVDKSEFGGCTSSNGFQNDATSRNRGLFNIVNSISDLVLREAFSEFITKKQMDPTFRIGHTLMSCALEDDRWIHLLPKLLNSLRSLSSDELSINSDIISELLVIFEHRGDLRNSNFGQWIRYLCLVSGIWNSYGTHQNERLTKLLFDLYSYLLECPRTGCLKMQELEFLLSSLLNNGPIMQQSNPDTIGELKDMLRDAFINSSELWSRKMFLLLIELASGGWDINKVNDYYRDWSNAL